MDWHVLLDGSQREEAIESVSSIVEALKPAKDAPTADASLGGGTAGLALMYAQADQALGWNGLGETAVVLLEHAVDAALLTGRPQALYSGACGIGWVLEHLSGHWLDTGGEDPNAELVDHLTESMPQFRATMAPDLVDGIAGLGVFALARAAHGRGQTLLEEVVDALDASAEGPFRDAYWFMPPEALSGVTLALTPRGHVNLGLAHGVPGILSILGEAVHLGIRRDKARSLIERVMPWLLSQKVQGERSDYPNWMGPGAAFHPSRLAWCYGDLGISVSLLGVARQLGRTDWETDLLGTARKAARRRDPDEASMRDAGMCHGFAGAGHLFNRLFQATGEAVFAEAACHWFTHALAFRRPGQGVGGYRAWHPIEDKRQPWQDLGGLVEGAAGVALALMAAVTPWEPTWDQCLLVSLHPKPTGALIQGG